MKFLILSNLIKSVTSILNDQQTDKWTCIILNLGHITPSLTFVPHSHILCIHQVEAWSSTTKNKPKQTQCSRYEVPHTLQSPVKQKQLLEHSKSERRYFYENNMHCYETSLQKDRKD